MGFRGPQNCSWLQARMQEAAKNCSSVQLMHMLSCAVDGCSAREICSCAAGMLRNLWQQTRAPLSAQLPKLPQAEQARRFWHYSMKLSHTAVDCKHVHGFQLDALNLQLIPGHNCQTGSKVQSGAVRCSCIFVFADPARTQSECSKSASTASNCI